jgi:hypothetical protein
MSTDGTPPRLQNGPGRPLKGVAATTSTERNKQRIDRLAAMEAASGNQKNHLANLTRELADSCLVGWAGSLAQITTVAALEAIAEYTRRNSQFFVTNGAAMLSGEARAARITIIDEAAAALKALAFQCGKEPPAIIEGKFLDIINTLHRHGFYPDGSLVSDVGVALNLPGRAEIARRDQLRRVVIVCSNFLRNLAFYNAGWISRDVYHPALAEHAPQAGFWRQANGNFLDVCVLEWCKLFGDKKAAHYWGNVVSDSAAFKASLLAALGMDEEGLQDIINEFREYRDKFIAHLDSEKVMQIPVLDIAAVAVRLYHQYIVTTEARPRDLIGLADTADKLKRGYEQCAQEAQAVFSTLAA